MSNNDDIDNLMNMEKGDFKPNVGECHKSPDVNCAKSSIVACEDMPCQRPTCYNPSLGMTLVMSILMFGIDRFYVGQIGIGVALLIGCLTVLGLVVVIPIQIIAQLSLVMAILTNRRTAFMYGCNIIFDPPTVVDKIIAICWLTVIIVGIVLASLGQFFI